MVPNADHSGARAGRSAFLNIARTAIPRALLIAELAIVTRALDETAFGLVMALVFTSNLMQPIAGGSHWTAAVRRYGRRADSSLANQLLPQIVVANSVVGVAVVAVGVVGLGLDAAQTTLYAVLMAGANSLSRVWLGIATLQIGRLLAAQTVAGVVRLGLLFAIGADLTAGRYLAVIAGTALIAALLTLWLIRPERVAPTPLIRLNRHLLAETWQIIQLDLMVSIYSYSDTILLAAAFRSPDAGGYAAAYRIFLVGVAFRGALLEVFLPVLAGDDRETVGRRFERLPRVELILGPAVVALGWLVAPSLVGILLGDGYEDAVTFLRLLAVVGGILVVNVGYSLALVAIGEDRASKRIRLTGLVGNLGLNVALIPIWGGVGAALATIIAEGLVAIGSARYLDRSLLPRAALGTLTIVVTALSMYAFAGA